MSKTHGKDDASKSADRTIRVSDYVEIVTRHNTRGRGTVTGFRDNHGRCPDTIVLEMDSDTVYSDENRLPGWAHDRERIPSLGVFGGEVRRIIQKTMH